MTGPSSGIVYFGQREHLNVLSGGQVQGISAARNQKKWQQQQPEWKRRVEVGAPIDAAMIGWKIRRAAERTERVSQPAAPSSLELELELVAAAACRCTEHCC